MVIKNLDLIFAGLLIICISYDKIVLRPYSDRIYTTYATVFWLMLNTPLMLHWLLKTV